MPLKKGAEIAGGREAQLKGDLLDAFVGKFELVSGFHHQLLVNDRFGIPVQNFIDTLIQIFVRNLEQSGIIINPVVAVKPAVN